MTTREQRVIDTLTAAIKSNNLVEFKSDGKDRKVEPYLMGKLYSIHQNHLEEGTFAYSRENIRIPKEPIVAPKWNE